MYLLDTPLLIVIQIYHRCRTTIILNFSSYSVKSSFLSYRRLASTSFLTGLLEDMNVRDVDYIRQTLRIPSFSVSNYTYLQQLIQTVCSKSVGLGIKYLAPKEIVMEQNLLILSSLLLTRERPGNCSARG